jgi:type I restriction enzyme R subunit
MKGRGVRVISNDDLRAVTPDARAKTRFVIIDAVGVCEQDKTESAPLERQPSVSLEKLLNYVAMGGTDPDAFSTLANRLARIDRQINDEQRHELAQLAGVPALSAIAGDLLRAIDPDQQQAAAQAGLAAGAEPTEAQVKAAAEKLARAAAQPIMRPAFRRRLVEIQRENEQTIDRVSPDEVIGAQFDAAALSRARSRVDSFRRWIEDNKDQITALQLIYARRYANRLRFQDVKELAGRIARPPLETTPEDLWRAYEALERSKVRGSGGRQYVDIVSLVRHAINPAEPLTPFQAVVMQRYERWLADQAAAGATFTDEQRQWLDQIAGHIATSVVIEREDFETGWFGQHGTLGRAFQLFGNRLDGLIAELNEKLVA